MSLEAAISMRAALEAELAAMREAGPRVAVAILGEDGSHAWISVPPKLAATIVPLLIEAKTEQVRTLAKAIDAVQACESEAVSERRP